MQFKFGELPDEHSFLYSVRPLVDWSFKVITWLGIAATFQIAAEVTNSRYLWAIYIIAYLLILFFLQSLLSWLFQLKRHRTAPKTVRSATNATRLRRVAAKASALTRYAFGFLIWWALVVTMQTVVNHAVSAIADFQKTTRPTHSSLLLSSTTLPSASSEPRDAADGIGVDEHENLKRCCRV